MERWKNNTNKSKCIQGQGSNRTRHWLEDILFIELKWTIPASIICFDFFGYFTWFWNLADLKNEKKITKNQQHKKIRNTFPWCFLLLYFNFLCFMEKLVTHYIPLICSGFLFFLIFMSEKHRREWTYRRRRIKLLVWI